jgi:hypothetical protein
MFSLSQGAYSDCILRIPFLLSSIFIADAGIGSLKEKETEATNIRRNYSREQIEIGGPERGQGL